MMGETFGYVRRTVQVAVILTWLTRCSCVAESTAVSQQSQVQNTTDLLNFLLAGYDKRLRPGFRGDPVRVDVNLNIRSMGPISELDMAFQMDCYFRQSWIDRRLAYSHSSLKRLQVSVATLERLWKPDTYFHNGKKSNLHTITMPNKFLRISPSGRILYSMRLTIKAGCPMRLHNFPMDTQTCPLLLGSHGYDTGDVIYMWTNDSELPTIQIASDMTLSQFDLIGMTYSNRTSSKPNGQNYSALRAEFILRRHTGYFMINFYVPISLLVIISWVGFWINREATADRISLGVTTVLTMTFVGGDNRHDLPKVSYSTALDYFVAVCFAFVLATIIQFAAVHFYTKRDSGEDMVECETDDDESNDELDVNDVVEPSSCFRSHRQSSLYGIALNTVRRRRQTGDVIGARHANSCGYGNGPGNRQSTVATTTFGVSGEPQIAFNNAQPAELFVSAPPGPIHRTVMIECDDTQVNLRRRSSLGDVVKTEISNLHTDEDLPQVVDEQRRSYRGSCWRSVGIVRTVWNCLAGDGAYCRPSGTDPASKPSVNSYEEDTTDRDGTGVDDEGSSATQSMNSVSRLDKMARFLFPVTFVAFHVCYWSLYANRYGNTAALTGLQPQSS